MSQFSQADDFFDEPTRTAESPPPEPKTYTFEAALDLCELDDRGRPTPHWSAKACKISPTRLTLRSRRMLFASRWLYIAIHLVDSDPVPLYGRVISCEYEGDGLYLAELDLEHIAQSSPIHAWARSLTNA